MPDVLISGLPAAGTISDADLLEVEQGTAPTNTSVKGTVGALKSHILSGVTVDPLVLTEGAAPANPAPGTVVVYAKTDGLVYAKDSAGTEIALSGGGGGGGGGAVQLVGEVILSVDGQDLDFTGLDLDRDSLYSLEVVAATSTPANASVSLYYNNDLTSGNYRFTYLGSDGSGAYGGQATGAEVLSAYHLFGVNIRIFKLTGQTPFAISTLNRLNNTGVLGSIHYAHRYTASTINVTSLKLRSSVNFAAGTVARLYKFTAEASVPSTPTFIPPPTTGWTWVNQGTAVQTTTSTYQMISGGSAGAGANNRMLVRTLAAATNYIVTACLRITMMNKAYQGGGLCLRNSSTGAVLSFDLIAVSSTGNPAFWLRCAKFTNPTTFSAEYRGLFVSAPANEVWLRIRDNGTTRFYEYSVDGDAWLEFFSVGRTDFTTPDQIGFLSGVENNAAPNYAPIVKLIHWDEA